MSRIIGNTTATPNPRPDWNQTDETKADYIKNKPSILTEEDVEKIVVESGVSSDLVQNISNALKGYAEGKAVSITDVSPLEHNIKVWFSGDLPTIDVSITPLDSIIEGGSWEKGAVDYEVISVEYDGAYDCTVALLEGDNVVYYDDGTPMDFIHAGDFIRYTIIDEESGEHSLSHVIKQTDASSVTLTKCGKNLFAPFTKSASENCGGARASVTAGEPYFIVNGTATSSSGRTRFQNYQTPITLKKGVAYRLSSKVISGSNASYNIFATDVNDSSRYFMLSSQTAYTPTEDMQVHIGFHSNAGSTYENQKIAVQLEVGKVASDYEEYKGEQYTPNPDGTVDGVTSLYPTTTLFTDTEGVNITAEYNKDTNKVINEISESQDNIESAANNALSKADAAQLVAQALETRIADAVVYTAQHLTEKQKIQARENIGAADAAFIETVSQSAQMLDLSSFERGKSVSSTYGDDINNLVDNEYYSTSNIIDFNDENRKTIAINVSKNFSVYGYIKSGDSYVRHAAVGATNFTQVGDHWEYTFVDNVVKLRLCIQNGTLATVENTLLMTYADEWEGASLDYGLKYKLARSVSIYEPFEGKNFCGIGDSIMQGGGDAIGGFLGILQEQYPSISVHNMGVGSTTMAQNTNVPANVSGKCILDRIDDIPDGQDYIILEGGLNDFFHASTYSIPFGEYESNLDMVPQSARWNDQVKTYANLTTLYSYGMGNSATLDTSTFCGAFEAALAKLVIRFFDKKYGVVIPHNPRSTADLDAYLDAEVRLCAKYGVPCLDLRKVAGMPRIYSIAGSSSGSPLTIDGVHPNHEGYLKRYLPPLIAWLKTL